jgi:hypothetical protein
MNNMVLSFILRSWITHLDIGEHPYKYNFTPDARRNKRSPFDGKESTFTYAWVPPKVPSDEEKRKNVLENNIMISTGHHGDEQLFKDIRDYIWKNQEKSEIEKMMVISNGKILNLKKCACQ